MKTIRIFCAAEGFIKERKESIGDSNHSTSRIRAGARIESGGSKRFIIYRQ